MATLGMMYPARGGSGFGSDEGGVIWSRRSTPHRGVCITYWEPGAAASVAAAADGDGGDGSDGSVGTMKTWLTAKRTASTLVRAVITVKKCCDD